MAGALRLLFHIAFFLRVTRYCRRIGVWEVREEGNRYNQVILSNNGRKTGSYRWGTIRGARTVRGFRYGARYLQVFHPLQNTFHNGVSNGKSIIAPIIELEQFARGAVMVLVNQEIEIACTDLASFPFIEFRCKLSHFRVPARVRALHTSIHGVL